MVIEHLTDQGVMEPGWLYESAIYRFVGTDRTRKTSMKKQVARLFRESKLFNDTRRSRSARGDA